MRKDIKERWVEALRSGEFQQGRGQLRNHDNTFCCLGVLCELAVRDGVISAPRFDREINAYYYDEDAGVLSMRVREWAGVELGNPTVTLGIERIAVAHLNDDGRSFNAIADLIEASL